MSLLSRCSQWTGRFIRFPEGGNLVHFPGENALFRSDQHGASSGHHVNSCQLKQQQGQILEFGDFAVSESISPENEVIGAATCDECRARIKILEKHRPLIGKAVRCPKCRALFTLTLDAPSVAEQQCYHC